MAQIALITSHYTPENTAATFRAYSFADAISKTHQVLVYTLGEKGMTSQAFQRDSNNLVINRIPQADYSGTNFAIRFVFELYYSFKLFLYFRRQRLKFDRVIISTPFLSLLLLAPFFVKREKIFLDCRDLVWRYLVRYGGLAGFYGHTISWWIQRQLDKFDTILVTNHSEYDEMSRFVQKKQLKIVSNGISSHKLNILSELGEASTNRIPGHFRILCCGNIGRALNLPTVLESISKLEGFELHVVGNGNCLSEIQAQYRHLENVYFHGKKKWEELLPFYRDADALYLQVHPFFHTSLPLRMLEYLATGKKIIFASSQESHSNILNLPGVLSCKALDIESHISCFETLRESIQTRNFFQEHLEFVRENHLRESSAELITSLLEYSLSKDRTHAITLPPLKTTEVSQLG